MAGSEAVLRISELLSAGEYLAAYDTATEVLTSLDLEVDDRARVGYMRALALARSGATERAEQELSELRADGDVPYDVRVDVASLRARLAKDRALELEGAQKRRAAAHAAKAYEAVYRDLGSPFPCINAATLWLVAGEADRARGLAGEAAVLASSTSSSSSLDAYWADVTEAEAALVLGELERAVACVARAGSRRPVDSGAKATTLRQLAVLCEHHGLDARDTLAPLANPDVVHYCGHMLDHQDDPGSFSRSATEDVRSEVTQWVRARHIGFAYGSLAAGGDLVAAEAMLESGADLHVVLPFDVDSFLDASVRPAGVDWERRFSACFDSATSVTVTSDSAYLGHDELFGFASQVAMGQAVIRAKALVSDVTQLAIWDGEPPSGPAGTARDVALWRSSGRFSSVITVSRAGPAASGVGTADTPPSMRPVRALLFGDMAGFGRLRDEDMLFFATDVMPKMAAVVDRYGRAVTDRNSWGDGIFVAFDDVGEAARCALALQEEISRGDSRFRMRMSVHVGPVLSVHDPVRAVQGTFGRELTRGARIEPRTPVGEVYATSAFAALLALDPAANVTPEYVGHVTTAKDFETIPMYVLKPRSTTSALS